MPDFMNPLLDLRKFVAPEFVFGLGASKLAGRYAQNLSAKRVLVVSDEGVARAGWVGMVEDSLKAVGAEVVRYLDVTSNPRAEEAMRGAEVFRSQGCDSIVAVGGGSPMDCAKGIGIISTNDRHVLSFEGVDNVPNPGPPLICVPTTAGSSADVSQFAIIMDAKRKVKIAIVSKTVVPDASLIDPELTTSMDNELTLDTGLDALTHAIEAYVSNANAPFTDLLALEAVRRIHHGLPASLESPDDLEARSVQMLGSLYAGMAFSNAILGAVHAMAHALGGLKDLPHGLCNAILLEAVVDHHFPSEPERYSAIGRALGASIDAQAPNDEKHQATLDALRGFKKRLGMTTTLADIGVTAEDLGSLARSALLDPCMATNPVKLDEDDVRRIFEKAL